MVAVVIDIDGVLFNGEPRYERHTKNGETDWDAAYDNKEVAADPVIPGAPAHTRRIAEQFNIIYITGRSEISRKGTLESLRKHNFAKGKLRMRGRQDVRSAEKVKESWIKKTHYLFIAAIDDDENGKLRDMYEKLGISHFFSFNAFFEALNLEEVEG